MYCGSKTRPPRGKVFGTPNQCFLKGRKAGFIGGISKGLVKLTPDGLNGLRKDVVREIAYRFGVTRYSRMTKAELINAIIQVKGADTTYNLDDLKTV
jgi:hypothetical protein